MKMLLKVCIKQSNDMTQRISSEFVIYYNYADGNKKSCKEI